jgi:hypothetical protein
MQTARIPKRVPVGTKYVIEGKSQGEGQVHVFSRTLVFPDGRCFELPSDDPQEFSAHPGAMAPKHRHGLASAKKH